MQDHMTDQYGRTWWYTDSEFMCVCGGNTLARCPGCETTGPTAEVMVELLNEHEETIEEFPNRRIGDAWTTMVIALNWFEDGGLRRQADPFGEHRSFCTEDGHIIRRGDNNRWFIETTLDEMRAKRNAWVR